MYLLYFVSACRSVATYRLARICIADRGNLRLRFTRRREKIRNCNLIAGMPIRGTWLLPHVLPVVPSVMGPGDSYAAGCLMLAAALSVSLWEAGMIQKAWGWLQYATAEPHNGRARGG